MGELSLEDLTLQLKALQYAARYPDYPKNFTPPALLNPNYVPPYRGTPVQIVIFITLALSVLIVGARVLARVTLDEDGLWWDDYLIIGGLVCTVGLSTIQLLLYRVGGLGYHSYDSPLSVGFKAFKMGFSEVVIYMFACFLIKLSIGFFLLRSVTKASPRWRTAVYVTMIVVCVPYIVGLLVWVFSCRPIAANWDFKLRLEQDFSCIDPAAFTKGITVVFAIGDIWLLVMPIIVVWQVHMTKAARVALTLVFATGGVACIAVIGRIIIVERLYKTFDASWNCVWISIWTQLEVTLGIISASLPPLQILGLHVMDRNKRSRLMRRGINTLYIFKSPPEVDELQAVEAARAKTYGHVRHSSDSGTLIKKANSIQENEVVEKPEPLWAPESAKKVFRNVSIEQHSRGAEAPRKKSFLR